MINTLQTFKNIYVHTLLSYLSAKAKFSKATTCIALFLFMNHIFYACNWICKSPGVLFLMDWVKRKNEIAVLYGSIISPPVILLYSELRFQLELAEL